MSRLRGKVAGFFDIVGEESLCGMRWFSTGTRPEARDVALDCER